MDFFWWKKSILCDSFGPYPRPLKISGQANHLLFLVAYILGISLNTHNFLIQTLTIPVQCVGWLYRTPFISTSFSLVFYTLSFEIIFGLQFQNLKKGGNYKLPWNLSTNFLCKKNIFAIYNPMTHILLYITYILLELI